MGVVIIGYSGHGFVVIDTFIKNSHEIIGYCDRDEKELDPYQITYLGKETSERGLSAIQQNDWFISIGENGIRRRVFENLVNNFGVKLPANCIHPTAILADKLTVGHGVLIGPNVVVNALATIGDGAILNTGAVIEHECTVGNFVHIAPGAVICGNVSIGENTFVGANSTIRQGLKIGKNVVIGAGAVVLEDVPDGATFSN